MKLTLTGAGVALLLSSSAILANDSVLQATADPGQYAIQTLDYANTRYSPLDQINRDGTTVLMATHDSTVVDQMRRRVIELSNGELIRDQSQGVYGYQ